MTTGLCTQCRKPIDDHALTANVFLRHTCGTVHSSNISQSLRSAITDILGALPEDDDDTSVPVPREPPPPTRPDPARCIFNEIDDVAGIIEALGYDPFEIWLTEPC